MRVAAVLLLCVGCGRTALPEPPPPEQPIELPTGPTVATLGGLEGPWTWTAPELMTEIVPLLDTIRAIPNNAVFDPILSEDGLTLYLTSDAGGGWDVYALTRPAIGAPYDTITKLGTDVNATGVSSFGYEPLPTVGTTMAFGDYPLPGVAAGTSVIVFADPSAQPLTWHGTDIDFAFSALIDPRITTDATALIFARTASDAMRHILVSKRASLADDFVDAAEVSGLPPLDNSAPWLSRDRRVLLFANADGVSQTTSEIWVASRTDPDGPFTTASPIAEINSAWFDGEPYVYENGDVCELYFVSTRPDIYPFLLYRSTLIRP